MSYVDQEVLAPIRARLLQNKIMRIKYGALPQDRECEKGEIFYGNLTVAKFETLSLFTKRKGHRAYIVRLFSEPAKAAESMCRVFRVTYEEAYGDKESLGIFVQKLELDMLGIEY